MDNKIICAANKLPNGVMLVGARHWDTIMRAQFRAMGGTNAPHSEIQQGFIDQRGNFYTRNQALKLCIKNGQIEKGKFSDTELFSEDLY